MQIQNDTYQQQSDLAKYCRTNVLDKTLKIRHDRVHHYRRLVFNVVNDSLIAAYPLMNDLLSEIEWYSLVNDFFTSHSCQSTQVWKMPGEFYHYVKSSDSKLKTTYPHLIDLIYFEWIEVEIFMMEDLEHQSHKTEGDWIKDKIAVNPEYRILQLSYPVHTQNSKSITESDKGEYFLLVFREKETGKVQFMDVSATYALIIENIVSGQTLYEILISLKPILKFELMDEVTSQIVPFFHTLQKKGFFPGFIK